MVVTGIFTTRSSSAISTPPSLPVQKLLNRMYFCTTLHTARPTLTSAAAYHYKENKNLTCSLCARRKRFSCHMHFRKNNNKFTELSISSISTQNKWQSRTTPTMPIQIMQRIKNRVPPDFHVYNLLYNLIIFNNAILFKFILPVDLAEWVFFSQPPGFFHR